VKPYFSPISSSIESQAEPDDSMLKLLRRTERSRIVRSVHRLFPAVIARKALGRPELSALTLAGEK